MLSRNLFSSATCHALPPAVGVFSRHAVLALALSMCTVGWAATSAQFDAAFSHVEQARAGDETGIKQSAQVFSDLLKAEPTHPVLMAYTGAATSMLANTTMLPWKKMTYAEDGLALLDKALALLTAPAAGSTGRPVPAALEVRFIAASTFLAVPGFMNRGERGHRLLTEVLTSPLLASAPLAFRGDVWLVAAKHAAKAGRQDEARRLLTQTIEAGAPQATVARQRLSELAS